MRKVNFASIFAALLCCANASLFSHQVKILDDNKASVADIALAVCKVTRSSNKQISRPSTVAALFNIIEPTEPWKSCDQKYGVAVTLLSDVIKSSNENVCSKAKISMIEEFHRRYISKVQKDKKIRSSLSFKAPKILKLFFVHYATAISNICSQNAMVKLNTMISPKTSDSPADLNQVEMIKSYTESMGVNDMARGFDGMFMIWNTVDSLPNKKNWALAPYLNEGEIKINIEMQNIGKLKVLQNACKAYIRPIYKETLLPVMRLVNMGYYPEDKMLAEELTKNKRLINLYRATQLCETIIPIGLYLNKKLERGQIVMLRAKDLSGNKKRRIKPVIEQEVTLEPFDSSMDIEQPLPGLTAETAMDKLAIVKANLRARSHGFGNLFKKIFTSLKSKLDSSSINVFLAIGKRRDNKGNEPLRQYFDLNAKIATSHDSTLKVVVKRIAFYTTFVFLFFSGILLAYLIMLYIYKYAIIMPLKIMYDIWSDFTGRYNMKMENALDFGESQLNWWGI